MRILVSAHACRPDRGSEPGVGWGWVKMLALSHELWVITGITSRPYIEAKPIENVRFFYPGEHYIRHLNRFGFVGAYLYYFLWQVKAFWLARRLCRQVEFDLVHHITIATYKFPSFLAHLSAPFVWGPLGGGEVIPSEIRKHIRLTAFDRARTLFSRLLLHMPGVRSTFRRARLILVNNQTTYDFLPDRWRDKYLVLNNLGLAVDAFALGRRRQNFTGSILYVGSLEAGKGLELLIRAAQKLDRSTPWSLSIVGSGRLDRYLRDLTAALGISDRVSFIGEVPHTRVASFFQEADIFCFPSLRDSGGTAVLEAMASALPVVCFNHAGPGQLVPAECGVKIELGETNRTISDLAESLTLLLDSPTLCRTLGSQGQAHARTFLSWEAKLRTVDELYLQVIRGSEAEPRRGSPSDSREPVAAFPPVGRIPD